MRIVLAEDHSHTRRRLARILAGQECEVASAGDGRQALEAIKAKQPDLVILDLEMPVMDGFAVLKELRMARRHVPVIVLTGKTAAIERALKLGADDYIVKPIDVIDFKYRLARFLKASPRGVTPRTTASLRREFTPGLGVPLLELHDQDTGRLATDKIADYVGIPLRQLATALGANYTAVHKTPAAESLQEGLRPIKRCLEILQEMLGEPSAVRAWLQSPHPDLGGRTPMSVILDGRVGALQTILENAAEGIPS